MVDGQSRYTSELTPGDGRRLEYYMPLALVRVLLPTALLSIWGLVFAAALVVVVAFVVVRKRRRKATRAV